MCFSEKHIYSQRTFFWVCLGQQRRPLLALTAHHCFYDWFISPYNYKRHWHIMVWQEPDCLDLDWTILKYIDVKTLNIRNYRPKKYFLKLKPSHKCRPGLAHMYNTAASAWDVFVRFSQLSGKKPKINRPIKQNNTWPKLSDCCTSLGNTDLERNCSSTLFSETLWVAVSLSNHTGHTGDTLYSFLKSKRRVNGLLEKANANPINQSLGWHQALS